jgi:hypothetical protein
MDRPVIAPGRSRVLELVPHVSARDVVHQLGCGRSFSELVTALIRRAVHTWVPVLMTRARRRATARTTPVSRSIPRSRTAERLWPRLRVEIVDAQQSRSWA